MTIHAKLRKLTLNDNLLAGPTNSHSTADGCLEIASDKHDTLTLSAMERVNCVTNARRNNAKKD